MAERHEDENISKEKRNQCGQCKHWMTDECPFLDDAKKGILKRMDDACGEFSKRTESNDKSITMKYWFGRPELFLNPLKKDPPCIRKLLCGSIGVELREKVARRLTTYFVHCRHFDTDKTLKKLKNWNKILETPLEDEELESVFKEAIHNEYVYDCSDSILHSVCVPCPLKPIEAVKEQVEFSDSVEKRIQLEVQTILESENILESLAPHLDIVIVNETRNKRIILVLLTGSRSEDSRLYAIITLKGGSRGGKNFMASILTSGFKVHKVSRFSKRGLDHANIEKCELLYIQELGEMDKGESGLSTLRLLHSGDRGIIIEYPAKDEITGEFKNIRKMIPAKTVVTTTFRIYLEPQFKNRTWIFAIDETSNTTEAVTKWKQERRRQEDGKKMKLRETTDYEFSHEVIKRVVKRIEFHETIIPFRYTIAKMFGSQSLRVREDIDKVNNFLELYANFQVKRLWKMKIAKKEVYVMPPKVGLEGLTLIHSTIAQMISGIEPRIREILEALKKVKIDGVHPYVEGFTIDKRVREIIARHISKTDSTVRIRLNAIPQYVSSDKQKGRKGTTHTLLYDVDDILRKMQEEYINIQDSNSLLANMRKEAQEWLRSKCKIDSSDTEGKISIVDEGLKNFLSTDLGKTILHSNLAQNQTSFEEKAEKNTEVKGITISKERPKCDWCDHIIDLSETKLERVGEYQICSLCAHDFFIRGYREEDVIREIKKRKAIKGLFENITSLKLSKLPKWVKKRERP